MNGHGKSVVMYRETIIDQIAFILNEQIFHSVEDC